MMRRSNRALVRLALLGVLGTAALALVAPPASAQVAAALGKPLPSPDLPVGTVSIRVVAGSAASPVIGTEVTLTVNGTPRQARTDAAGRATFAGLPAGATVVAKVLDADKAEHASDQFALPSEGGTRVMITTKPWQAGAVGGAPFAGGGGAGMPNPRQLSGEARPERGDPPGTITVRVTYDDFKDTPDGVPVVVVGYAADNTVSYKVLTTDKAGRVVFTDLDRSGGTSYFVMTELPRNGAIDRVMSLPILLDSQNGMRLALSSEKRDSKAPVIDDLNKADPQGGTPAGKVRVGFEGAPDPASTVALFDVETGTPIAQGKAQSAAPDPSRIEGGDAFDADAKAPAGKLTIEAAGGPGKRVEPLKDIEIRVVPAGNDDPTGGVVAHTGDGGMIDMTIPTTGLQKAIYTVNGRAFVSKEFDVSKSGGQLTIRANWDDSSRLETVLDAGGTRVVYAVATSRGERYRSMPFQLLEGTGSKISVYVYPRIMLRFVMQAYVDDSLMAVQGRLDVMNSSWIPYRAGPDGLLIPLPRGFRGGIVYDPDQAEVSVAVGEGFRVVRPVPPGSRQFHGGFTLPVEDGKVAWSFDLPLGAFQSELDIKQTPGMQVTMAARDIKPVTRTVEQGTFSVIAPLNIRPGQSMALTVEGLPSPPAWQTWVPIVVGVMVVLVMLGGIGFALIRKPEVEASAEAGARRQALLDELVGLERSGGSLKRREQLLAELESIWS